MFWRNLPNRKSIRLKGWDYRNPGLYFITICTKNREHHFGKIRNGIMGLSVPGCITWHFWREIPDHQENVVLDEFIVMPDHIHAIIGIEASEEDTVTDVECYVRTNATTEQNDDEAEKNMSSISPKSGSISAIIRSYKSAVTKWCNAHGHEYFAWQSRFYDHIIRNEGALQRIRKYIRDNPLQWQLDLNGDESNRIHERAVEYMIVNNKF